MTQPGGPQRLVQSRARQVHLVLRDGGVVEGGIFLNEGQALAPYLGSRKGGWVNIVNALWLSEGETSNHAVLQADHILMASSPDNDVPVYGTTAQSTMREVEIAIEDGTRVRGVLNLAEKQRLSDYLHACGKFVPVLASRRMPAGTDLGDIALNCLAVRVIRDAERFAPGTMDLTADAQPDGPSSATAPVPAGTPALVMRDPADRNLTEEQQRLATWLSRHWLVQLGAGAQLAPPDPRTLPAHPSLEDVWHGLAARNDMADGEIAVQVAAAFKLPLANLDWVTADALAVIPEKIARKVFALPLRVEGKDLVLAVSDPSSMEIEQQIGFITRMRLRFEVAPPADIRGALDWHYGTPPAAPTP